jgi:hypothetical protein
MTPGVPCQPDNKSRDQIKEQREKQGAKNAQALADPPGGLGSGRLIIGPGRL